MRNTDELITSVGDVVYAWNYKPVAFTGALNINLLDPEHPNESKLLSFMRGCSMTELGNGPTRVSIEPPSKINRVLVYPFGNSVKTGDSREFFES